jgi:hypothetical protein
MVELAAPKATTVELANPGRLEEAAIAVELAAPGSSEVDNTVELAISELVVTSQHDPPA